MIILKIIYFISNKFMKNRFEDSNQIDLENLESEIESEIDLEYTNRQVANNNSIYETRNENDNIDVEVEQEEAIAKSTKKRDNKEKNKSSHANTKKSSKFVFLIVNIKIIR